VRSLRRLAGSGIALLLAGLIYASRSSGRLCVSRVISLSRASCGAGSFLKRLTTTDGTLQPTQFYETQIANRDMGEGFAFITVPARSLMGMPETARDVAEALEVDDVRDLEPAEPWGLPFLIDAALGRVPEFPWIPEPPWIWERGGERRGRTPTPFAQYLVYESLIPFEASPLESKSLAALLVPGSGASAAAAYYMGHPILIVVVPAGILLGYAVKGIGEGLQIGLRVLVLRLMGVKDPE
jgi:hypothetical protein